MATSLEELKKNKKKIKKTGPDWQRSHKYLPFGEKIVKIGPVDPEIALLNLKKKKETECKIYNPVGNLAERANAVFIYLHSIIYAANTDSYL